MAKMAKEEGSENSESSESSQSSGSSASARNSANSANSESSRGGSFFDKLASLFGSGKERIGEVATRGATEVATEAATDVGAAAALVYGVNLECCSGRVHIAYRGVSDDRLYLAENRTSNEVKFFRPNGLRVFCSDCRKRLF